MPSLLNPYLGFDGNARQALEFYHAIFGGELDITTYAEGKMAQGEADKDRIMHGMIQAENGMTLMASDAPPGMPLDAGSQISISLSGQDEAELRGYWDKLSEGGQVTMPLEKAPWGDTFGMLTDKFGIKWMVNVGMEL